jgi:hypothetical protein
VPGAAASPRLTARQAELLPAYDLLFRAASETLLTIAADPKHLGALPDHVHTLCSSCRLTLAERNAPNVSQMHSLEYACGYSDLRELT